MENEEILKKGTKVRYVGEDGIAYEYGKIYEILGYDEFLDGYGIMSELGYAYVVGSADLIPVEENDGFPGTL